MFQVWKKVDEEDVCHEDEFKKIFHTLTISNPFTNSELDGHIDTYCDEGKEVMRSEGTLYRISL